MPHTPFDRDRIALDMAQLTELLERKQAIWTGEHDTAKREALLAEMEQHTQELAALKAQMQEQP